MCRLSCQQLLWHALPRTRSLGVGLHLLIRLEDGIGHLDGESARHNLRSCDLPLLERTRTRNGILKIGTPSTPQHPPPDPIEFLTPTTHARQLRPGSRQARVQGLRVQRQLQVPVQGLRAQQRLQQLSLPLTQSELQHCR